VAANPRMVINDIDVAWDGGVTHVPAATVVDVPPGSVLEAAYGASNLADLTIQGDGSTLAGTTN